jgi:threonine aldolase
MVPPHGGVVCHREAHIEMDEGGAPGFFLHGAKLLLADGDGAKLTPDPIRAVVDAIRRGVHQVQPHAISITQATECGRVYTAQESSARLARWPRNAGLASIWTAPRFANAIAHLGCAPAEVTVRAGVDALTFGCVKNGGMSAEAIVFFAPDLVDVVRYRRKRAGRASIERPLPRGASARHAGRRSLARQRPRRPMPPRRKSPPPVVIG